jgi:hypothetical protein
MKLEFWDTTPRLSLLQRRRDSGEPRNGRNLMAFQGANNVEQGAIMLSALLLSVKIVTIHQAPRSRGQFRPAWTTPNLTIHGVSEGT